MGLVMHAGVLLGNKRRLGGSALRVVLAALLYGAGLACASVAAAEAPAKGFVALILPGKSKSLKPAAEAIKAGVLAAEKVQGSAEKLPVRLFETGDAEEETLSLFNLAKSQGAVAVIGPLTRSAMNYLSDAGDLSIPVLALNSFDDGTLRRRGLYSFGLSIEAEVQQVVRLMRSQQIVTPMVLQAEGPLSMRMQKAFVDEWLRTTGAEPPVLVVSDARAQALELQTKLAATDSIFFAADGRRASLIRPYLPSDRSFYATSQIAGGRTVSVDLSGVRYVEMPWLANPDAPEYAAYARIRSASNDVERLFALGVDAWQLAQLLAVGQPIGSLDGLTGRLEPGAEGVILREMIAKVATVRGVPSAEAVNASQPAAILP